MTVFKSDNENQFPHRINIYFVCVYLLFYDHLFSISIVHNLLKNNKLRTTTHIGCNSHELYFKNRYKSNLCISYTTNALVCLHFIRFN